jgi:hypothetical protein
MLADKGVLGLPLSDWLFILQLLIMVVGAIWWIPSKIGKAKRVLKKIDVEVDAKFEAAVKAESEMLEHYATNRDIIIAHYLSECISNRIYCVAGIVVFFLSFACSNFLSAIVCLVAGVSLYVLGVRRGLRTAYFRCAIGAHVANQWGAYVDLPDSVDKQKAVSTAAE